MRLMDTVNFRDLNIVCGSGPWLISDTGKQFLDFFTDVGTSSLGYNPPELKRAMEMLQRSGIVHSPILFPQELRTTAANKLCKMTGMDNVFFCNSGAEAVEGAIKLARRTQWLEGKGRTEVWTFSGGFHGRTLAALAAGDGPPYHNDGFGPLPADFHHFTDIDDIPTNAAAVMLAPVLGNNNVHIYPDIWLGCLREYTAKHDILLIFDEVQTGAGRTGAVTYAQSIGVHPDIITLGKGIAMGAPVGAVLARDRASTGFSPGTHFSTFGGNPLCAAFIITMLEWLSSPSNLEDVNAKGLLIRSYLNNTLWSKGVRQVGMLTACDVDFDTVEMAEACEKRGLLLGAFRSGPGPLKITPPLNIGRDDLHKGLDIINDVAKEMSV